MPYAKNTLALMMISSGFLLGSSVTLADTENVNIKASATLPTIVIEAMADGDPIKTYVDYKQASVTRNGLDKKDIPQTVDTLDVSKYKLYGANSYFTSVRTDFVSSTILSLLPAKPVLIETPEGKFS